MRLVVYVEDGKNKLGNVLSVMEDIRLYRVNVHQLIIFLLIHCVLSLMDLFVSNVQKEHILMIKDIVRRMISFLQKY